MKYLYLIYICLLISCNNRVASRCTIPKEVMNCIIEKKYTVITEKELIKNWKDFSINNQCPTIIDFDFTRDGNKDFICMIRDNHGISYLVAFNDYESKINYQIIDGIADYGDFGIGNILYQENKKGFYSYKIESSKSYIYWEKDKYLVKYSN